MASHASAIEEKLGLRVGSRLGQLPFTTQTYSNPKKTGGVGVRIAKPVSVVDAIEFAELEMSKGTVFWPRLIVACVEESEPRGVFCFAVEVYEFMASDQKNTFVMDLVEELRSSINCQKSDVASLHRKSSEIWENLADRSPLKRGVTRFYNAIALKCGGQRDDYEVEVTRALQAAVDCEDSHQVSDRIRWVISKFREDYGNGRGDRQ